MDSALIKPTSKRVRLAIGWYFWVARVLAIVNLMVVGIFGLIPFLFGRHSDGIFCLFTPFSILLLIFTFHFFHQKRWAAISLLVATIPTLLFWLAWLMDCLSSPNFETQDLLVLGLNINSLSLIVFLALCSTHTETMISDTPADQIHGFEPIMKEKDIRQ